MRKHLKNYFIPHADNEYRPHSVRFWSLASIIGLACVVTLATMVLSIDTSRDSALADVHAALLTTLTSQERTERNLLALKEDPALVRAAEMKARDMIQNQYFAHTSPRGVEPWHWFRTAGYDYKYAGENLAIDFYDTKKVSQAWMDSPTHRANILNGNYTDIGIAVEVGQYKGRRVAFVVQMFGTKKEPASQPSTTPISGIAQTETQIIEPGTEDSAQEVLGAAEIETPTEEPEATETNQPEVFVNELPAEDLVFAEANRAQAAVRAPYLQTHIPDLGRWIMLALVGLVSLSLLLKVAIETRKQHYGHVAMTLVALALLIGLYAILAKFTGYVIIA